MIKHESESLGNGNDVTAPAEVGITSGVPEFRFIQIFPDVTLFILVTVSGGTPKTSKLLCQTKDG